jgi:methionyl-tRNA formyltransferase
MRILLLANNGTGRDAAAWLRQRRDCEIVGVVVHPRNRAQYREDILKALSLPRSRVFDGSRLRDPGVLARIRTLDPELGLSVYFGYILTPSFLRIFPRGCVNLHPAYLPYNRGAYPNVWSIVDGTPAGVTLHYVDEGIDTGNIVAQRTVPAELRDTGATLYRKLQRAAFRLLRDTWPLLAAGSAPHARQPKGKGSSHRVRDTDAIDAIDPRKTCRAGDLIDLLRARTFPPYPGAYIRDERGRKLFLQLRLSPEKPPRKRKK